MPNLPYLYATDFIDCLKKKHKSGSYKEMVINLVSILVNTDRMMYLTEYVVPNAGHIC